MKRFILPFVFLAGLVTLLAAGLGLNPREVPSPLIGKPVPEFTLPTLADPEFRVSDRDLKGQPYLFNVWASWCPTCYQEHPLLMQLAERGVNIIGLNIEDERTDAIAVLEKGGDPYRVVLVDYDGRSRIDWGVIATPETFLVDAIGVIQYKHTGAITWQDWAEVIAPKYQQLLTGAPRG
jgi:cytochrome c biogenesis protein CcmG/thiol:disulfide interchange protein DsbE